MLSWPARELWRGERVVKSAVNSNNNNNTNNNNKASYLLSYLTLRDKIPEVSSVRLKFCRRSSTRWSVTSVARASTQGGGTV